MGFNGSSWLQPISVPFTPLIPSQNYGITRICGREPCSISRRPSTEYTERLRYSRATKMYPGLSILLSIGVLHLCTGSFRAGVLTEIKGHVHQSNPATELHVFVSSLPDLPVYRTTHYNDSSIVNRTAHLWNKLSAVVFPATPDVYYEHYSFFSPHSSYNAFWSQKNVNDLKSDTNNNVKMIRIFFGKRCHPTKTDSQTIRIISFNKTIAHVDVTSTFKASSFTGFTHKHIHNSTFKLLTFVYEIGMKFSFLTKSTFVINNQEWFSSSAVQDRRG